MCVCVTGQKKIKKQNTKKYNPPPHKNKSSNKQKHVQTQQHANTRLLQQSQPKNTTTNKKTQQKSRPTHQKKKKRQKNLRSSSKRSRSSVGDLVLVGAGESSPSYYIRLGDSPRGSNTIGIPPAQNLYFQSGPTRRVGLAKLYNIGGFFLFSRRRECPKARRALGARSRRAVSGNFDCLGRCRGD